MSEAVFAASEVKRSDLFTVAIAGNPNCGKNTLYNALTGGRQHIGNWPGVTVEKKEGIIRGNDEVINLIDLPGIYTLSAVSTDEIVARDFILSGEPDLIVNIVDATNLERNLYLTSHLIEMKVPVLVVLNMLDLATKQGIKIDTELLSKQLGLPVIGISALSRIDIERVKGEVHQYIHKREVSPASIRYPNEIEEVLARWIPKLDTVARRMKADVRWVALKLFEGDEWIYERVVGDRLLERGDIEDALQSVEKILHESPSSVLSGYRYGFIHAVAKRVTRKAASRVSVTDRLDRVVMHPLWGIPIFVLVMYIVFWATIKLGGSFITFFDVLSGTVFVDGTGTLLSLMGAPRWLVSLLAGGVGVGIQTVATFIPIIFMMFLMLSLLEDSGYMARAAFIMDRFMRRIGLPGKAFVPLIVGFGCTVPAVMATRSLENRKDRYLTVFMAPLMSCGARLPVYALFGAAFFPRSASAIVFSIYIVGVLLAILTGLIMKKTLFRGEASHFLMELPPYHTPRIKHILFHAWIRVKVFILRAGTVIIIAVALLGFFSSLGTDGTFGNENTGNSTLALVGKTLTPVFHPMGIEEQNWPATVALLTGVFAKEAIVGTLNSMYRQISIASGGPSAGDQPGFFENMYRAFASIPSGLYEVLRDLFDPLGLGKTAIEDGTAFAGGTLQNGMKADETEERLFSVMRENFSRGGLQAYAYLLFILIYFPCAGAVGAIVRELGRLYALLEVLYLTLLGWVVATLFYQIAVGREVVWIIVCLLVFIGLYGLFALLGRKGGVHTPAESDKE